MAEQVLSQEEVDALLSAMSKGEVDLEGDTEEASDAVLYDLTSQNRILQDQFEAFEKVYDDFVILLRGSLTKMLRRSIEVEFVSTEMTKFGDFLKRFSAPSSFNIFGMAPLVGSGMLVLEAGLVFSLIDCLFGGNGKPVDAEREFTRIEQGVIKKFVNDTLKVFEKAMAVVVSLEVSVKGAETKPRFAQLVAPDEGVIIAAFSIDGGEFNHNIYFCLPLIMLEPIKEKLSYSKLMRASDSKDRRDSRVGDLLTETVVSITVELGKARHYVRDVLSVQVGDVIILDRGPQDPIVTLVEGIPKYYAVPGTYKGSKAVQITALLRPKGGENNHE
ncbi:MAG: flagellar motor switch protein FliM [Deltaproteobacteria bacterium]|nr:flagellar motor switch protein FliM [Deltaproteobacteria bacterium]